MRKADWYVQNMNPVHFPVSKGGLGAEGLQLGRSPSPPLQSLLPAWVTAHTFLWLQWRLSKQLQRQELDCTSIYMCAVAVTFPGQMHHLLFTRV